MDEHDGGCDEERVPTGVGGGGAVGVKRDAQLNMRWMRVHDDEEEIHLAVHKWHVLQGVGGEGGEGASATLHQLKHGRRMGLQMQYSAESVDDSHCYAWKIGTKAVR